MNLHKASREYFICAPIQETLYLHI